MLPRPSQSGFIFAENLNVQKVLNNRRTAWTSVAVFAGLALTAATVLNAQPAGDSGQPTNPQQGPGRGPAGPGGPGGRGGENAPVSVERSMKGMGRALSRLAKQVTDTSKKAENIGLISDAQRACVAARAGVPKGPWSEEQDATKRLTALIPYRKDMIALEQELIAAELAMLDDKNDVAKGHIEKCLKLRDEGHKRMGIKDDE